VNNDRGKPQMKFRAPKSRRARLASVVGATAIWTAAAVLAFPYAITASEKARDAQGLGALLGVSSIFTALAPASSEVVSYCDRYLASQPAALYYGDFWRVRDDGRYVYDPAVKAQFQGVMYREDDKVITISQLRRGDAQKELKLYLDGKNRVERMEYRFESGPKEKAMIQTETHLFARSQDSCIPLERREEVTQINGKSPVTRPVKSAALRYNLALCQEIRSKVASDPETLTAKTLNSALARSLRDSMVKHDLITKTDSRGMADTTVATQALLTLHECETTSGVREALRSGLVSSIESQTR
jgi:hypothetical protein